jgi:hypothetical protein
VATAQQVPPGQVFVRVREISNALTEASRLVERAAKEALDLVNSFDRVGEQVVDLPRFEGAVYSTLATLARNLGADLGDGLRGDFQLDTVTDDARELVELLEFAVKGDDDV